MDIFPISNFQLLILMVIPFLFWVQKRAIKKGQLVKVEYAKPRRLFWAVSLSAIAAIPGFMIGNMIFIALAIVGGIYLYFFKQWYELKRD